MTEEHVIDLLPAYALGSLDEAELLLVARHLPECAVCRGELATYWPVVDQLAQAAPLRTPPAALKGRILQQVGQGLQQPSTAPSRREPVHAPRNGLLDAIRGLLARPAGLAFGALALALVLFLGVSNVLLWQQVNALESRVPEGNLQIVNLNGTQNAPQAQGYLMVFNNENYGTLVVEDAPALEPGYQYQLWLIRDGKRTSGGVFSVDEHGYGALQITSPQPLQSFPSFGVTVEPAGGSPGPTGERVLGGDL